MEKFGAQGAKKSPGPAGLRLLVCDSVSVFGRYEIRKFQTEEILDFLSKSFRDLNRGAV